MDAYRALIHVLPCIQVTFKEQLFPISDKQEYEPENMNMRLKSNNTSALKKLEFSTRVGTKVDA